MNDYYKILNIDRNASEEQIKKSYRKLAKKYHPDSNSGNKKAETIFKQINEAYSTLSDKSKRAEYDRRMFGTESGNVDENQSNTSSNSSNKNTKKDINKNMTAENFANTSGAFEDFFGFDPKSDSPNIKKKSSNVKAVKSKDIFEAVFGKKRK